LLPTILPANWTQQYWVNVTIPDGAKPARYTINVQVLRSGLPCMTLPVTVDVLPFELEPSPLIYSIYHLADLLDGRNPKTVAQYRAECEYMVSLGITRPIFWQDFIAAFIDGADPALLANLSQALELRAEAGITNDPLYIGQIGVPWATPETMPRLLDRLSKCYTFMDARGIHDIYVMGWDEPDEARLILQRSVWAACRREGFKTMCAVGMDDKLALRIAGPSLDLPLTNNPTTDLDPWHAARHDVWLYGTGFEEKPETYRRQYGLAAERQGFQGICPYPLEERYGTSQWDDSDSPHKDFMLAYPIQDGVLGTLQGEAVREAHTDLQFAATLESLGGTVPDERGQNADAVRTEIVNQILLRKG